MVRKGVHPVKEPLGFSVILYEYRLRSALNTSATGRECIAHETELHGMKGHWRGFPMKRRRLTRSVVWSGREDLAFGPATSLTVPSLLKDLFLLAVGAQPLQILSAVNLYSHTMVGARGFEPPTSCSQSRRATGLRYAPTEFLSDRNFLSNCLAFPNALARWLTRFFSAGDIWANVFPDSGMKKTGS